MSKGTIHFIFVDTMIIHTIYFRDLKNEIYYVGIDFLHIINVYKDTNKYY